MQMKVYATSDVGKVREINEDYSGKGRDSGQEGSQGDHSPHQCCRADLLQKRGEGRGSREAIRTEPGCQRT